MPIKEKIEQLRETMVHLPQGTNFPVALIIENWVQLVKLAELSTYYNDGSIYTIIKIPLITHPAYKIIHVIPLSVYQYNDVFAVTEITFTKIAINVESNTYLILNEDILQQCTQINTIYM